MFHVNDILFISAQCRLFPKTHVGGRDKKMLILPNTFVSRQKYDVATHTHRINDVFFPNVCVKKFQIPALPATTADLVILFPTGVCFPESME